MDVLLLQVFNGLSVGSILLLIALGLTFSFGLMKVINMAHGEFIMAGAYVGYLVHVLFRSVFADDPNGLYFPAALILAFVVTALMGLALEFGLIRHLYGRPLDTLLATWGVGLVLQQVARSIFGAPNVQVITPYWLNGGLLIGSGLELPYKRLFILVLVAVSLIGIYLYQYRSASGRRMRAVMQDRDMASCLGVSVRRVDGQTFAIGSGFAGLAGCALTLLGPIGPALGTYYIVDAFLVVVLGGVGQLPGAIAAALLIGIFNTAFEFGSSATLGKVFVFAMIIAFLQWKPSGLIALRAR